MSIGWQDLDKALTKKYLGNYGDFCDLTHHPILSHYRRYRRGIGRCSICGARIGEPDLRRKSYTDNLIDFVTKPSPMLKALMEKKGVV